MEYPITPAYNKTKGLYEYLMKMNKIKKSFGEELNTEDLIILDYITQSKVLRNYVADSRKSLNIPKNGYNRKDPIPLSQQEIDTLKGLLSWKTDNVLASLELPRRWAVTIYALILFGEVVPPKPKIVVTTTPRGIEILITDRTTNISYLKNFLKSNGLEKEISKIWQKKNKRKKRLPFKKYEIRLFIAKHKEEGKSSEEIVKLVRKTFSNEDLPDPLRTDLRSDTSPENCINSEYDHFKKKVEELNLSTRRSFMETEFRRLVLLKKSKV